MIRAQATVDNVALGGKPSHLWRVHVSDPSHDLRGEYTVVAETDDEAAREGLRKFEAEFDPGPDLSV
jgi:hypothetical protein